MQLAKASTSATFARVRVAPVTTRRAVLARAGDDETIFYGEIDQCPTCS